MSYVYQHVVFGAIVPTSKIKPNYNAIDEVINHKSVSSFYNGNRLDEDGSFVGIKLKTLDSGSNTDLNQFLDEFDRVQTTIDFDKKIEELKSLPIEHPEIFKDLDFDEFVALIGKPKLMIIPETE